MDEQKAVFVFAHPAAHELLVAGLMQHHCADVLFVTQADSGAPGSSDIARECLQRMEFCRSTTFLEMSEVESYGRAFAGDFGYYAEYRNRILDWLLRTQPDVIYGDALEFYNFHHDLTRMLLDDAVREYRRSQPDVKNYEIANVCRTDDDLYSLRRQEFPLGEIEVYSPTPEEIREKERMLEFIGHRLLTTHYSSFYYARDREVYRTVPADRDYTLPPAEYKQHYEDWGIEMARRGKYKQALLFDQHFVPIARHLQGADESVTVLKRAA